MGWRTLTLRVFDGAKHLPADGEGMEQAVWRESDGVMGLALAGGRQRSDNGLSEGELAGPSC